jgi:hypothetical protein
MNKELKEMTNIGVPVYNPITMSLMDTTLKCSDNKVHTINIERDIRQEAYKRITKAVGGRSNNNSKEYLKDINFFANNQSSSVFDLDEIQRVVNVYEELAPLERKPISDLNKTILNRYKALLQETKKLNDTKMFQDIIDDFSSICYGKPRVWDLRSYLNGEVDYYGKLNKDFDKVLALDFQDLFNAYTDTLNPEKTSLFIACHYLDELRQALSMRNLIKAQECVFYLSAYLDLKINQGKKIYYNNESITNETIKAELHKAFMLMPELKVLNYERSFFEGKPLEDNKAVIDTLLKIKDLVTDEVFIKKGDRYVRTSASGLYRKRDDASAEEKEAIAKLLADKEYAYLKHHPIAQIECHKRFSNYKAFVYENGIVPADRFKGIYHLDLAKQDAVYVFDADNFEELIKLNKQELQGIVPRFYHSKSWKDKVAECATKETTPELEKSAQILARKIEKK